MVVGKLVECVYVDVFLLNLYLLLVDILEFDNILVLFIYFVLRMLVKMFRKNRMWKFFIVKSVLK